MKSFLAALITFCFSAQLFAQNDLDVTTFQWFPVQAIHPISRLKTIEQDQFGNIWVGSDDGLFKYYGGETELFEGGDKPLTYVKKIIQSKTGDLLVIHDGGLSKIRSSRTKDSVELLLKGDIVLNDSVLFYPKTIFEEQNRTIWMGEDKAVVRFAKSQMQRFTFPVSTASGDIFSSFSFAEDGFQQLWVMFYDGQLYRFERSAQKFTQIPLPQDIKGVNSLISRGTDRLWVGAIDGIYTLKVTDDGTVENLRKLADIPEITKLELFGQDQFLVGTRKSGLFRIDDDNNIYPIPQVVNKDIVDFQLNSQAVWLASNEDVELLHLLPFSSVTGTENQLIPSIGLTLDNELIINDGYSISFLKNRFDGYTTQKVFDSQRQFFINKAFLHQGRLWLAGSQGLVYSYDMEKGDLREEYNSGQSYQWIMDIYKDNAGAVWIFNRGPEESIEITAEGEIRKHPLLSNCWLAKENDKGWLLASGNTNKIFVRQNGSVTFYPLTVDFGKEVQFIYDFDFYQDQTYLATDQGLYRVNLESLQEKKVLNPKLIHEGSVSSVAVRPDGVVWFSNPNGIVRLEGESFSYFDPNNGLPSRRVTERGLIVDLNDDLWIATSKGVGFIANEALLDVQTLQPHLTQFKVDGEIKKPDGIDLGKLTSDMFMEFSFTTLSFPVENLQYRAELYSQQEKQQVVHEGASYFSLLGLTPGKYTLEVSARQKSGRLWSTPASYTFMVSNPFYRSNWFFMLIALLTMLLIILGTRLYNLQLKRSNQRLDQLVHERTKQLNEQKEKLMTQQEQLLEQKNDLLEKNRVLNDTKEALVNAETKYLALKDEQLQKELELKDKQLTTHALTLIQKNQAIQEIGEAINAALKKKDLEEIVNDLRQIGKQIEDTARTEEKWDEFKLYFEQVYTGFYSKLKISSPDLTPNDLKHCALIRLNLSLSESASLLGISSESVRMSRFRIQKKLDLHSQQALVDFLMKL